MAAKPERLTAAAMSESLRPFERGHFSHCGHPIRLSESVHQIGASPRPRRCRVREGRANCLRDVEAPSGFEPEMEVLQTEKGIPTSPRDPSTCGFSSGNPHCFALTTKHENYEVCAANGDNLGQCLASRSFTRNRRADGGFVAARATCPCRSPPRSVLVGMGVRGESAAEPARAGLAIENGKAGSRRGEGHREGWPTAAVLDHCCITTQTRPEDGGSGLSRYEARHEHLADPSERKPSTGAPRQGETSGACPTDCRHDSSSSDSPSRVSPGLEIWRPSDCIH